MSIKFIFKNVTRLQMWVWMQLFPSWSLSTCRLFIQCSQEHNSNQGTQCTQIKKVVESTFKWLLYHIYGLCIHCDHCLF